MKQRNSTKEILSITLLFIMIGFIMYSANSCNDQMRERIKDRVQTQNMIDYHKSQGRDIIVFD